MNPSGQEALMFALIYDEYDLSKPRKKIISVHGAEKPPRRPLKPE
jgi:hypothetical protein